MPTQETLNQEVLVTYTCVHCGAVEHRPVLITISCEPIELEKQYTCPYCSMDLAREDSWAYAYEDDDLENPMGEVDADDWPF